MGSVEEFTGRAIRQSGLRSKAGCAVVSTEQQDVTAQRDGLHALATGDHRIYVDRLTGTKRTAAFKHAHPISGSTRVALRRHDHVEDHLARCGDLHLRSCPPAIPRSTGTAPRTRPR